MESPYIGQVFMYGFDWAPRGFTTCIGQLLPIVQNAALFSILGTTFGGNGVNTFALPDLRGRVPIHWGQGPGLSPYVLGEIAGTQNVTILPSNLPLHSHALNANTGVSSLGPPSGNILSQAPVVNTQVLWYGTTANAVMNPAAIAAKGSNVPISVIQPYSVINYSIALQGIFPSRN